MKIIRLEDAKEWLMYPLARAAFTADDLQRFTEIDTEETPMDAFLAELEHTQQLHDRQQSP